VVVLSCSDADDDDAASSMVVFAAAAPFVWFAFSDLVEFFFFSFFVLVFPDWY